MDFRVGSEDGGTGFGGHRLHMDVIGVIVVDDKKIGVAAGGGLNKPAS